MVQKNWVNGANSKFRDATHGIDRFHLTSRRPYWCTKTMKWRPYWCTVRELALSYSNISYCFTTPLGPPITWVKTIYCIYSADFALEQSRPLGANIKVIGAISPWEPARRLPEYLDKYMSENKVVGLSNRPCSKYCGWTKPGLCCCFMEIFWYTAKKSRKKFKDYSMDS